jgi:hypothetical protein
MPAYLIDVEYPSQDVKQTVGGVVKAVGDPMNMIFFAMCFMMLAVVLMGVNPWIGIIAGLAYGLSTYFFLIIDAGHITKMWALVYAPPLVGAVWYTLRRNVWVGAALASLFGSLELAANHPQISYYFVFVCLALWISEFVYAIIERGIKRFMLATAMLAVAAVLSVGSNFAPLYYTMKHKDSTSRGVSEVVDEQKARQEKIAYNTAWSYGKAESLNMFVPNYMGAGSAEIADDVEQYIASGAIDESLYEDTLDDITDFYRQYDPSLRRQDIEYLASTTPEIKDDINWLYGEKWMQLSSYISAYWGKQPGTAGPTYLGAALIMLALMGIVLAPSRYRWWVIAASLFALLLAWGSNLMGFYELMYDYLPGYSNFRTVSMALVVVEWSVPLLAALAIYRLCSQEVSLRQIIIAVAVALGVVVVMVVLMFVCAGDYGTSELGKAMGDSYWVEQLKIMLAESRREAFVSDMWRSLGYVVAVAVVAVGYAVARQRMAAKERVKGILTSVMVVVLGILVVVDIVGVDKRYMNDDKWHEVADTAIEPSATDKKILEDKELGYRVYDMNHRGTARASYFHRSVDGYHGAKLQRYNEVYSTYIMPGNSDVLAMLNTRYVVVGNEVETLPTYGAAWFVNNAQVEETPAKELAAIGVTDLHNTMVVDASVKGLDEWYDNMGSISLVEYAPNYLKYEYDAPAQALCVFSEIYYPDGWTAYVDGKQVDYFCADYVLRGMELPAGKHTVEWKFRAPHWGAAIAVTGVASWIILLSLLAVVVASVYLLIKKRG